MKKVFLIFALLGTAIASHAQALYNNENNHSYFGARAGLDISSASESHGVYNNRAGFHLGAVYNLPVYMNLYFEPGLSFFYDTFGISATEIEGAYVANYNGYIGNAGFRIPFNFGYHFDVTDDISVSLFTGPQLNISFLAKSHVTGTFIDDDEVYRVKESESIFGDGGFKHVDLQWNFGASVSYQKYYLSVSGAPGITKAWSIDGASFRRNLFQITVGYNF